LNLGRNIYFNLVQANIYLDNKDEAIVYLYKYGDIYTKLVEQNFQNTLTETEVKYETEKKELRIEALEKERELYAGLGIATAAILLLAFGLLFFRNRLNVQKRRLAEQMVKQLEQEKQLIAIQATLDTEIAERQTIARDLHDGLGGLLSAIKMNLANMQSEGVNNLNVVSMVNQSIVEMRRIAHHIMPEALALHGLAVALKEFCAFIPSAKFNYIGGEERLESHLETLFYNCAYELVNNALKHSNATTIDVDLLIAREMVSLSVHDNGIGFDPETVEPGNGLKNIRNRVDAYKGKLNIYTSPGKGTEINIEVEQSAT
jgi:signal transduction histidine kinase